MKGNVVNFQEPDQKIHQHQEFLAKYEDHGFENLTEYLGSFTYNGKLSDYYKLVHNGTISIVSFPREIEREE